MAQMKLILRTDIDSLGRLGDLVTVKAGYGRNFLIPQGMAMPATEANLRKFEQERRKLEKEVHKLRTSAKDVAGRLEGIVLEIPVRVGDNDKLYGSVTTTMIGDYLDEMGVEIDRRKIVMEEPIRSLGEYELEIKLHPDVHSSLKVNVVRHKNPAEEPLPEVHEILEEDESGQPEAEAVSSTADDQPEQQDEEQVEE